MRRIKRAFTIVSDKWLDMKWKAQRPAIEIAAELIAAACVGGAAGFAVWSLAPLGAAMVAALGTSILGATGALLLMAQVDRPRRPFGEGFEPVDFADGEDEADVLMLDDPLPALTEDSRVVRLFAVPTGSDTAPLPAPGEMVARIEDFLGATRPDRATSHHPAAADASAALHAALADIRRSLRQA